VFPINRRFAACSSYMSIVLLVDRIPIGSQAYERFEQENVIANIEWGVFHASFRGHIIFTVNG